MINIRKLTIDDYDGLCALWEAARLPYKPNGRDTCEKIATQIDGDCSIYLAAEEDGRLVGAILGTHDGRKGWINRLAVSPDHRGRGIATMLVRAVEKACIELGIEIFACQIEDWNTTSMAIFDHLGYTRHDDIIYFTKRLRPGV